MGRHKKADIDKAKNGCSSSKETLENAKLQNGFDLSDLLGGGGSGEADVEFLPTKTMKLIREQFGKTKEVVNEETGEKEIVPLYSEEKKIEAMMGLMCERGMNIMDFLEELLAEGGYSSKVLFSINETFDKTTNILRDMVDLQYKKEKLKNDRTHLEIMKYKADLKKREIDLKEKSMDEGISDDTIIAVASPAELMRLMKEGKISNAVEEAEVVEEDE